MHKYLILASLFAICSFKALASNPDQDLGRTRPAFQVNYIWYNIPPGYFVFQSTNPELTFGEAMKKSGYKYKHMEITETGNLALNSTKDDHVYGFKFLLMLQPCNDYKVTYPPLVSQILKACALLKACKPSVIKMDTVPEKIEGEPQSKKTKIRNKGIKP